MTLPVFAAPPDLLTPGGYIHVVTIPPGRLAWTAGQVPMTADREVPEGWEAQTRLAFENAGRALRAAGAEWSDVVKLTLYVTDVAELGTIRSVRGAVGAAGCRRSSVAAEDVAVPPYYVDPALRMTLLTFMSETAELPDAATPAASGRCRDQTARRCPHRAPRALSGRHRDRQAVHARRRSAPRA